MATNREMLKEAIADAKAVKETAIANAKAALEEAFAPQLKSMLSMKLQEMEEVEEMEDKMYEMEDKESMKEVEDDMTNEIDLEELLAELELEEGDMEGLNEAEEEEEEEDMEMSDEESEEGEEEGEPIELEDMTDEDLKDMIEDVIKDMIESGELEAGHEGGEGEEEGEESEEGEEEEIDLAELLREIEEMEEEPIDELFGLGKGSKEQKIMNQLLDFFSKEGRNIEGASELVKLDPASDEFKSKVGKILQSQSVSNELGSWAKRTGSSLRGIDVLANFRDALGLQQTTTPSIGDNPIAKSAGVKETMKAELDEAYSTIEALKSELNEINLLNAKLLYTNKIFKAKNLNESQKVKVLSSFDKAKNVGEVKMVFETLNEGIKVSKNTIKENLGSASKGTMTPSIKKPIVESNEAFLRMQKLAGII